MIRLLTRLISNDFWSRIVAFAAFGVATLNILGLLAPTIVWLDQLGFRLGETRVSALDLLRAIVELVLLLWLAVFVSRLLEARVQRAPSLTPSLRVLTSKLIRFSLIALALVVALTSTGIDLTAFALFTGALGVGIGFGLQKPISNLISGLILLFDRSIKPGDVVELTDPADHTKQLFGWVTALNARYVSLTTRDGTEWLVPNEDLISRRVINWSYSHNRLRLLTPIGVSFDCDVPAGDAARRGGRPRDAAGARDPAPGLPADGLRRQRGEPRDALLDRRSGERRHQRPQPGAARDLGQVPRQRHPHPARPPRPPDQARLPTDRPHGRGGAAGYLTVKRERRSEMEIRWRTGEDLNPGPLDFVVKCSIQLSYQSRGVRDSAGPDVCNPGTVERRERTTLPSATKASNSGLGEVAERSKAHPC